MIANIKCSHDRSKKDSQPSNGSKSDALYLDKLELSDTVNDDGGFRRAGGRLSKRARRKAITKVLMVGLMNQRSPLASRYALTFAFCAEQLLHDGDKITSRYCGYRWCPVCNGIRTAKFINGYMTAFLQFKDPYMVTLTAPSVHVNQLSDELERRQAVWSAILKHHKTLFNRGQVSFKLDGIRKLEVTPRPGNYCHPHLHLIIDGYEQAQFIKRQWLARMPDADKRLQDVRKANKSSLKELFKYVSKFWSMDKSTGKPLIGSPYQMDQIFQALVGKRTIKPFGRVRMVSEEIEKLQSETIEGITPRVDISVWDQAVMDWIDTYGECISGYTPSDKDKQLIEQIEQTSNIRRYESKKSPPV